MIPLLRSVVLSSCQLEKIIIKTVDISEYHVEELPLDWNWYRQIDVVLSGYMSLRLLVIMTGVVLEGYDKGGYKEEKDIHDYISPSSLFGEFYGPLPFNLRASTA